MVNLLTYLIFLLGGAVLTVAYSPEANDGSGIQLIGNTLPEGELYIPSTRVWEM